MPRCSCLGKNPDCFRCGGWGWLGEGISKNRSNFDYKKTSNGKTRKISDLPTSKKLKKTSKFSKNLNNKNEISCPYCLKQVKYLESLDLHISLEHDDKWNEYFMQESVNLRFRKTGTKRCPICKYLLRNLEKHLKKKHGFDSEGYGN